VNPLRHLLERRRRNTEVGEQVDSRVRLAQEVMEDTVAQLHAEIVQMRVDRERERDEDRQLYLELAQALRDCDRERVRLMIKINELLEKDEP
jgi:2,4-dienoyl-CoA reductase-like NADH-dependent reductase (Old Yellow Enzyme family)